MFVRRFSVFRTLGDSWREHFEARARPELHNPAKDKSIQLWRNIFHFVCLPALFLSVVNCFFRPHEPPPEFIPYEHLRIRRKPFPWGDGNKSLFHNPHTNALPDGYEKI